MDKARDWWWVRLVSLNTHGGPTVYAFSYIENAAKFSEGNEAPAAQRNRGSKG